MYAIYNDNIPLAVKLLKNYSGPLAEELDKLANQKLDFLLEGKISKLITLFNYKPEEPDSISNDDAIVMNKLLKSLKSQFSESSFLIQDSDRLDKIEENLSVKSRSMSNNDIFLGPDSQDQYPKLSEHKFQNSTVIRLLPGKYDSSMNLNAKRIKIIACTGVKFDRSVIIKGSNIEISSLTLIEGDLIIEDDSSNIVVNNSAFLAGGIHLQGKINDIEIDNCLLRHIKGNSSSEKISISNSTIVEMEKAGSSLISGIAKSTISNSILHSDSISLFKTDNKKMTLKLKLCLLSTSGPLAKINNVDVYSLEELGDKLDGVKNCLIDKAEFKNLKENIFTIKEFSPGFKSGQDGRSMGANFNENDHLQLPLD